MRTALSASDIWVRIGTATLLCDIVSSADWTFLHGKRRAELDPIIAAWPVIDVQLSPAPVLRVVSSSATPRLGAPPSAKSQDFQEHWSVPGSEPQAPCVASA